MNRNTTNVEKKLKTTFETVHSTNHIALEGVKNLRVEKSTKKFEVVKEIDAISKKVIRIISRTPIDEVKETLSFTLSEVTPEALANYRKEGIPSFILKVDGKLYYSEISSDIDLMPFKLIGTHKCAAAGHECRRLSSASDAGGGCAKVRARSNFIERYPWITTGYETINTRHDVFIVNACSHYEVCPPRKHISAAERNAARLSLAQFVWDDVETLQEVRARRARRKY